MFVPFGGFPCFGWLTDLLDEEAGLCEMTLREGRVARWGMVGLAMALGGAGRSAGPGS